MNGSFDVFLSHNSKDKTTVRRLAEVLKARGLKVWLDEEQLVPGRPWQDALEAVIQMIPTAAVLVGKDGLGPWEIPEMRACLSEFVERHLPVIPVLLPDAPPTKPELPLFLRAFTWVDLRDGLTEHGLNRLVWGITGVKHGRPIESEINIESVLCKIPHDEDYFKYHGKPHVQRMKQFLKKEIFPLLKREKKLNPLEEQILLQAVDLHEIEIANPHKDSSTNGQSNSISDMKKILEKHTEVSQELVKYYSQQLGIPADQANLIANLCSSHRGDKYIGEHFKDVEEMDIANSVIRIRLLAALLKLADAADIGKAVAEKINESPYYKGLCEEDRKHWNACKCISAVKFPKNNHIIKITAFIPPDIDPEKAEQLVREKAILVFSELFAVMPFTLKAGLPWCMVEINWLHGLQINESTIWKDWWLEKVKVLIEFDEKRSSTFTMDDIANQLSCAIMPQMPSGDILNVLKEIEKKCDKSRYHIPPQDIPQKRSPAQRIFPIINDQGKKGFIEALKAANECIDLFGSDGRTYPKEVYEILEEKALLNPPVRITIFLLSAPVLFELEKEERGWQPSKAEDKINIAKKEWKEKISNIKTKAKDKKEGEGYEIWFENFKEKFQIYFIDDFELAHLNGSLLVDNKILRLNIHNQGGSSSAGAIIYCNEPVNILHVVQYQAKLMREKGEKWAPWENEQGV